MSSERVKSYPHRFNTGQTRWMTGSETNRGTYHRDDGPAIYDGGQPVEWWLDGRHFKNMNLWLEANHYMDEDEKLIFKLQCG